MLNGEEQNRALVVDSGQHFDIGYGCSLSVDKQLQTNYVETLDNRDKNKIFGASGSKYQLVVTIFPTIFTS